MRQIHEGGFINSKILFAVCSCMAFYSHFNCIISVNSPLTNQKQMYNKFRKVIE